MMKKLLGSSVLAAALFLLCTSPLWAGIPQTMAFQGRLTSSTGKARDGNFTVTFRIFDAAIAGMKLWEETKSLTITTGLFSTLLGSVTALNLSFDKPYWVEIQFGSELLVPRQPLAASPYTFRASRAQQVDGINVVGSSVGIGTTTPEGTLTVTADNSGGDGDVLVAKQLVIQGLTNTKLKLNLGIHTEAAPAYVDLGFNEEGVAWRNLALVKNGGSVGIGTEIADSKLTIQGDGTAPYLLNVGGSSNGRMKVRHIDGKDYRNGNPSDLFLQYGINANTLLNAVGSGGVGIGTSNPGSYKLYVNGPAYATGGWQGSSIALKTDIHPLSSQEEQALLKKLAHLPLYRYRLKNPDGLKSTHLGVLAEETISELVDDKHKAVSYGDTLAVLMASVKAQQQEIAILQAEIEQLKARQRK